MRFLTPDGRSLPGCTGRPSIELYIGRICGDCEREKIKRECKLQMMDARATHQRMHTEQSKKKLEEAAEKYHRVMARLGELVPRNATEAVKEASQAKIRPPV